MTGENETSRTERLKQENGVTEEYGVSFTLDRGSKYRSPRRRIQYWSPAPTSEQEAIELTKQEYDDEIEEVHGVESREVPAPAKWSDDDPRIRSVDTESRQDEGAPITDGGQDVSASPDLVSFLAGCSLDHQAEFGPVEESYPQLLAFTLATFVDGVPITPMGFDESEKFSVVGPAADRGSVAGDEVTADGG